MKMIENRIQPAAETCPFDRGVGDQRRDRARYPADDHRERRARLQPERVHEDVEEDRGERDQRRRGTRRRPEHDRARRRERQPEEQRAARVELARGQRTHARALHLRVAVALEIAVERARRARRECGADERPRREPERRPAPLRHHERRQAREDHERQEPRLGERDVLAERAHRAPSSSPLARGERATPACAAARDATTSRTASAVAERDRRSQRRVQPRDLDRQTQKHVRDADHHLHENQPEPDAREHADRAARLGARHAKSANATQSA